MTTIEIRRNECGDEKDLKDVSNDCIYQNFCCIFVEEREKKKKEAESEREVECSALNKKINTTTKRNLLFLSGVTLLCTSSRSKKLPSTIFYSSLNHLHTEKIRNIHFGK